MQENSAFAREREQSHDWRDSYIRRQRAEFVADHGWLVMKYGGALPPVEKGVDVITVVPAYREWQNDNFWRLLRSFSAQKGGTPVTENEILYVVNNSLEDARNENEAFQENQITLECLRLLQEAVQRRKEGMSTQDVMSAMQHALEALKLSVWEKTVFAQAVEAEIKMFGIDASRLEAALPKEVNARGQSRNIGGHIAYERLRQARTRGDGEGMIDFIDADCYLSKGYYQQLSRPHAGDRLLIKTLVAYTPDISEYVDREPDALKKLVGLIQYLKYALLQGRVHYLLHVDEHGQPLEHTGHGPSLAVQPSVFKEIGGYPRKNWSEDFIFHGLLQHVLRPAEIKKTGTRLNLSHRSREDASDGFQLAEAEFAAGENPLDYLERLATHVDLKKRQENEKLHSADRINLRIQHQIQTLLSANADYENDPEYRKIRHREFRRECLQRSFFLDQAKQSIEHIVKRMTEPSARHGQKTESYQTEYERMVSDLPAQHRDYFLANPSLLEAIMTVYLIAQDPELQKRLGIPKTSEAPQAIFAFFERYLPEFFAVPPKKEPDYNALGASHSRDVLHLAKAIHEYRRLHGNDG